MSADFESDVFIKERDETDVLSLRSAVWGTDHPHTSPAFMQWLFATARPLDPCGVTVRLNSKVIGFAGLCRKRIVLDGRIEYLAHGLDYMILPDVKGLAAGHTAVTVARQWLQLTHDLQCAVGLVFPNENSYRILTSAHVGLKPMFQPVLMLRPLSGIVLTKDIKRIPRRFGTALLRIAALYGQSQSTLDGADSDLVSIAAFGKIYDNLWASIADRISVGVIRDSAYLNWRYVDHPVYRYDRLSLNSDGGLLGFVVGTPRETFGVNSMLLVDLVARDGDETLNCSLVTGLVRHARLQGQHMVASLAVPGSKLYATLKRCGFFHVPVRIDPKPFRTAGVALIEAAACAWDPTAWYFTWGDMDVV